MGEREVAESCFDFLYGALVDRMILYDIDQDDPEESYSKLEAIGYDVGYRIVERWTRSRPQRLRGQLEIIKFICKDFWIKLYKKQVDKLQTNHRGVFVLQDFNFKLLRRASAANTASSKEQSLVFLVFPCGLIRGALANLGITSIVSADITSVPGCLFNIKIEA